jgi:hypothetical protein
LPSARTGNELHRGNANTGTGTWQVPVLEMNSITAMPNANTGMGTWQVPVLEMNSIVALSILVRALGKCPYWK